MPLGTSSATPAANHSNSRFATRASEPAVIALVGNPNTGKTSLFNALTGFRRHVANYPGVTVDVARGPVRNTTRPLELLDLPGTYSLAARSPDEAILCNALRGRLPNQDRPAAILAIVDASNPLRNFYLVSQILEVGLPVVVALNMVDVARARGIEVDAARLAERLGVPVVPVVAIEAQTIEPLVRALESVVGATPPRAHAVLPEPLRQEAISLSETSAVPIASGEALRILVDRDGFAERQFLDRGGAKSLLLQARERLRTTNIDAAPLEVRARYAWIDRLLDGVITRRPPTGDSWSSRIDRVLTHRVGGALALLLLLYGVFYAIYAGARPFMDAIQALFGGLGDIVASQLPNGVVQSLIVDGLIAGVGGVLVFLPQIVILFVFIALLEDCGYMSRAAFLVDRLMRPIGLSGRAFIPLLSGFACAVPAIMGTRAIADRRERLITILILPFMSCSARLPIYMLLIGAFVPSVSWLGGWVRLDALLLLLMYSVGVVFAAPLALLLRKTVFAGPSSGFLLELPSYKVPRLPTVWQRVYFAGRSFVVRAGTVILVVNLVVWALGYFPHSSATLHAVEQQRIAGAWDQDTFESQLASAYLRDSVLGQLGHGLEPAIKPLGWDWRIGVGVIASFPAREVILATLGTVANLGRQPDADSMSLSDAVRAMTWEGTDRPVFTFPVALSLMFFFALCAQCSSTLVMIGRETGSWSWPVVSLLGMTALAYAVAWGVSAGTRALGL